MFVHLDFPKRKAPRAMETGWLDSRDSDEWLHNLDPFYRPSTLHNPHKGKSARRARNSGRYNGSLLQGCPCDVGRRAGMVFCTSLLCDEKCGEEEAKTYPSANNARSRVYMWSPTSHFATSPPRRGTPGSPLI
jgi:hypothetical protein